MNKQIEKKINEVYKSIFNKVYKENASSLNSGSKKEVVKSLFRLEESKKYEQFCKEFAAKLAKLGLAKSKGIWKKYYQAAKERGIIAIGYNYTDFEKKLYKETIKNNFKLIKSIPSEIVKVYERDYTNTLLKQALEGKIGRGSFEKQLKEHGVKNARVIARTETAKIQTAITENTSRELGSVAYIWISTKDKRTRQSHKDMNGVVVFWRPDQQKPLLDGMRGNAGEFPNCRCDTMAIYDERDLTKSTYTVYDYKTDKKIKMSKADLLKALENGGL